MGKSRKVRIAGRDQACIHMRTVGYMGPMTPPTPAQVRSTLARLAALYSGHRILRKLDHQNVRWITVPAPEMAAHCERMVVDLTGAPATTPESVVADLYNSPASDLPVRFVIGRDFCALLVNHACVDGLTINAIWPEIIRCAVAGEDPAAVAVPSIRMPLLRALDNYYRRSPKRILATLRAPHSVPPAETNDRPTVAWQPEFAVVSASAGPAALEQIRKWRLEHARGITRTMVLFAAARAALEQVGLTAATPGLYVIGDIRKFLPAGARLDGNFASAVYITPADPTDPVMLNESVDTAFSAARPLATMALVAATASRRRRKAGGVPDRITQAVAPVHSLVHTGRLKPYEKLPWTGDRSERRYVIGSTPGGSDGISVFISEIHGGIDITATFHATTFDRDAVAHALEMMCKDPASVLDASRARREHVAA
ncbi:MAG: hypothetical protein ACQSGP_14800 [Frankia sp.]